MDPREQGEQFLLPALRSIRKDQILLTGGSLLTAGVLDVATHFNGTSAFVGLLATAIVARHSNDILNAMVPGRDAIHVAETTDRVVNAVLPAHEEYQDQSTLAKLRRLAGMRAPAPQAMPKEAREDVIVTPEEVAELERYFDSAPEPKHPTDMLPPPPTARSGKFLFSSVLAKHQPTLDKIYLGSTMDGTEVYCTAKDLCHVALTGPTGGGKSVLMRMLMAQLCKAGAQVLLLNPHYTRYDIEHDEDWTPFTPYLVYDPMECRKYDVIEYYLRYVAEKLLPKRLDKFAHSLPLGRPYFIVLDELPAIVRKIPNAAEYLGFILREGRKVGIFVISAAQDFLVKTIGSDGGGVRDCYRTAYYTGGDPTTAKVLLDMVPRDIPENELGQGIVMLRCATAPQAKKAIQARVPYVDNEALYRLLGPSTYQPASAGPDTDELPAVPDVTTVTVTAPQSFSSSQQPAVDAVTRNGYDRNGEPEPAPEAAVSAFLPPLRPEGWDEEKVKTLPMIYRACNNIDKCLQAMDLSTSQRNRDYARDLLKEEGMR